MAARIPLGKAIASGTKTPSIRIRLDDPPFWFDAPSTNSLGAAWTGSVAIQNSVDTQPDPQGPLAAAPGGTLPSGLGVLDANARWETIVTITSGAAPDDGHWRSPLTRVRVDATNVTSGAPDVYLLAGIRSLKTHKSRPTQRRMATRNGG